MSQKFLGYIEALLSASFFGLIPFFYLPIYTQGFSAETSIIYRFLFASLIMLVVVVFKKQTLKISFKNFLTISFIAIGCFSSALCLLSAISFIPSGIASTLFFINPIFVMLLMIIFEKEPVEAYKVILSITTFFGVALLSGFFDSLGEINFLGVSLSLLAGTCYAVSVVGMHKAQCNNVSKETLSCYVFLISFGFSIIYCIVTQNFVIPQNSYSWLLLVLASLVTAVLPNVFLMSAIKKIGSVIASILGAMEPITAVTVGIIIFHESLSFIKVIGILVIIFSVVLITTLPMLRKNIPAQIKNIKVDKNS